MIGIGGERGFGRPRAVESRDLYSYQAFNAGALAALFLVWSGEGVTWSKRGRRCCLLIGVSACSVGNDPHSSCGGAMSIGKAKGCMLPRTHVKRAA